MLASVTPTSALGEWWLLPSDLASSAPLGVTWGHQLVDGRAHPHQGFEELVAIGCPVAELGEALGHRRLDSFQDHRPLRGETEDGDALVVIPSGTGQESPVA